MRANPASGLVVDGMSGNLWLAIAKDLHRFDLQGRLQESLRLKARIGTMSLDRERSVLWVAQKSVVSIFDLDGHALFDVPKGLADKGNEKSCADQEAELSGSRVAGKAQPRCIFGVAYDAGRDQAWVSFTDRLQRYDSSGALTFELLGDFRGPLAADGSGGAWVSRGSQLLHVSADGVLDHELMPFTHRSERPIAGLAADPSNGSVWVTDNRALMHVAPDGALLHDFVPEFGDDKMRRILDLVFYADVTPPEIRITTPHAGALLNQVPTIDVEYSDLGTGVNPETLQFQVNGTVPGATVRVYSGTTLLGSATATGSSTRCGARR